MNSEKKSMAGEFGNNSPGNNRGCLHRGRVVELVIRRNSASISDIARALQVSRRTLYNWFEAEDLDFEIVCKIGYVLNYDFTKEFPQELPERLGAVNIQTLGGLDEGSEKPDDPIYYWMRRYIKLLEAFNEKLMSGKKLIR
ncbi:helix-turn-helix domain-containing protein [Mucilaginibacter gossypii]|uniref:helix-turn-helix domain-containing protein n=1 Tax=Mucilaginibacter gossypii TaxID=551996 RepID=UPI00101A0D5E|nr:MULTISPECIES: helix-turn-helix domain-containing protein [Mucilaginibacter]QTE38852.1 helix-turn-helix domain-containing protein [Mucilaginibacter gossypii]